MSSPQKQVGNRRLPPLPCTSMTIRPDKQVQNTDKKLSNGSHPKASSSLTNSKKSDNSLNGSSDMDAVFLEGPFRNNTHFNLETSGNDDKLPQLSKLDPNMFLHGKLLLLLLLNFSDDFFIIYWEFFISVYLIVCRFVCLSVCFSVYNSS